MTEILAMSWLDTKIHSWRWGQYFVLKRRQPPEDIRVISTAKNW